jgi:hypothetical protein
VFNLFFDESLGLFFPLIVNIQHLDSALIETLFPAIGSVQKRQKLFELYAVFGFFWIYKKSGNRSQATRPCLLVTETQHYAVMKF